MLVTCPSCGRKFEVDPKDPDLAVILPEGEPALEGCCITALRAAIHRLKTQRSIWGEPC